MLVLGGSRLRLTASFLVRESLQWDALCWLTSCLSVLWGDLANICQETNDKG